MEPMKSVSGLCALLFGLIGGAFVLMGAVFGLLKVPVRGAVHSGWAFVPLGLACLLLALACAGLACRRRRREARLRAAGIPEGTPLALSFEEGLDPAQLRRLCLAFCEWAGLAAVFSGGPQGWKYAVGSAQRDVRELGKRLNQRFAGRGGGQKELVQGTLTASRRELEAFFREEAQVF